MTDWEAARETLENFCSKFFSLIIGVIGALASTLMLIGVMRFGADQSSTRLPAVLFLSMLFAVGSSGAYLVLHFIPSKAFRLMHILTGLLIVSVGLQGLAMGVTAPTVDDCHGDPIAAGTSTLASLVNQTTTNGNPKGELGQSLGSCSDQTIIFAAAVILLLIQVIAVFDVQRLLLGRVVAKSYGDRFVEMGIK